MPGQDTFGVAIGAPSFDEDVPITRRPYRVEKPVVGRTEDLHLRAHLCPLGLHEFGSWFSTAPPDQAELEGLAIPGPDLATGPEGPTGLVEETGRAGEVLARVPDPSGFGIGDVRA